MATGDTVPPLAPSSPPPPLLDNSPSNLSSPLSEPEDKDAYGDDADLDMRDLSDGHNTPSRNGIQGDADSDAASESDDESKLSEVDVNDSEAETERLYDTPLKNGATRDIVNAAGDGNRRFTDRRERVFERSPSKLHQQLRADIDAGEITSGRNSASEGEDGEDDDASMPSSEPELDSVKAPRLRAAALAKKSQVVPSNDAPTSHPRKNSADSRKRKRSSVAEQSDSEQPLKKRTGSVSAADRESADDIAMIDDDGISTNPQSGNHTAEEDNDELLATTEAKEELADAAEEDVAVPSRSRKGRRSPTKKRKSKSPADTNKEEAPDEPEDADAQSLEVPTPQAEDDHADEVDEEAEAAHRNEEERMQLATPLSTWMATNWIAVERKKAAWEELIAIEKQFSSFRERYVHCLYPAGVMVANPPQSLSGTAGAAQRRRGDAHERQPDAPRIPRYATMPGRAANREDPEEQPRVAIQAVSAPAPSSRGAGPDHVAVLPGGARVERSDGGRAGRRVVPDTTRAATGGQHDTGLWDPVPCHAGAGRPKRRFVQQGGLGALRVRQARRFPRGAIDQWRL
jgi:hypothetical protein